MRFVLLLPLVAGFTVAGCGEDEQSLVITHFVTFEPAAGCVSNPMAATRVRGTLDLGIVIQAATTRGYMAAPVVQNRLVNTMQSSGSIAGRYAIQVSAVDVELVDGRDVNVRALPEAQRKFRVPVSSVLLGAGTGEQGGDSAGLVTEIIPPSAAMHLAANLTPGQSASPPFVIARVRGVGTRAGGNEVIGAPADFPVELCSFCLTPFATPPACPAGGYQPDMVIADSCFVEQDRAVTCCFDENLQKMLCGADVPVRQAGG